MIWIIIYLWLLLAFAVAFFMEASGSPYTKMSLIIRGLLTPILFPFAVTYEALHRFFR